jgi:outer membrane receptor for ferrienterochelin and colicins
MIVRILLSLLLLQPPAAIVCTVTAAGAPVAGAEVVVNGRTYVTDSRGVARIELPAGQVNVSVVKPGFAPVTSTMRVDPGAELPIDIALEAVPTVEESVTVSATRTERGIEDQPMRVEVLDREEIGEKLMMTPGDVEMMLNEMGGMRVQATSPSLGAASIRIQGMRGRYTRFLSDGLPLYGEQVSLGLMQIPPLDLGRAEVIKGVASSLYGAGAMGGVVNLVSRRPGAQAEHTLLLNRSTRGATDADGWYSAPISSTWGMTVLASVNGQQRTDVDGDRWADLPKYTRGVIRPRLFYDSHDGRTFYATAGGTVEDRIGGSMPGTALSTTGEPYVEALNTRRWDGGAMFQTIAGSVVWSARGSWSSERQDHTFGDVAERDDHSTGFAEVTARRRVGVHTLVGGAALEGDTFRPRQLPKFGYAYTVPGIFVQDDADLRKWLTVSAAARLDHHSESGTFLSPHVAGLVRQGPWSARLSFGEGFSAPTPNTEETEGAGLARLVVPGTLRAEEGRSTSLDVTHRHGPLSATLTLFHSRVLHPLEVDRAGEFTLRNLTDPITNAGIEALAVWKTDDFSFVANYAYVHARETLAEGSVEVPLTPRHSVGLDFAWEWEGAGRLGVEWYYTGQQRLEDNPYRTESRPYSVFGLLGVRRLTRTMELFINGENLTDVRQSRWDPLLRPSRGVDGRWTVDAWAPLDGRNINGGLRVSF